MQKAQRQRRAAEGRAEAPGVSGSCGNRVLGGITGSAGLRSKEERSPATAGRAEGVLRRALAPGAAVGCRRGRVDGKPYNFPSHRSEIRRERNGIFT